MSEQIEIINSITALLKNLSDVENDESYRSKINHMICEYMTIFEKILNQTNLNEVLNDVEQIKRWRSINLNEYLFSIDDGEKLIELMMKLKLTLMKNRAFHLDIPKYKNITII